ncbi:Ferrichrome-iron receptor [Rubrivivax sp. A210]|uniref:TonB-dependent siderophore receptor n=1 Tax=Rubrivivax sp. A210 TaxID=2772301 RepID=UPI001917F8E2|nr:TonB-dependent receptor [Rubrivivax sp. A210]CAD5366500.1 Ferrichrome-iron receptor [Rubrivivax sp. A210]
MASPRPFFPLRLVALAAAVATALPAAAQQDTVTITGTRQQGHAGVAGFGDMPLARTPVQAASWSPQQLADSGIASLGALTRLDASVGDAYNAEGYWAIVSTRGYTLDNRFNYRRDGLPINAETALPLDNKERLELLKGTSGMQAGTSAPGGLVNLIVKRPAGTLRQGRMEWRGAGSVLGAVDLGESFGSDGTFGLRINAAYEHLNPPQRHTHGERHLIAAAADWQLGDYSLLQAELEISRQRQPSVAGFSMLGASVPGAQDIDPRLNLNDQPWRQPVVFDGQTASLRWRQRLAGDWQLFAHAMQQKLRTDDNTAFPFGLFDPNTFDCGQTCDRYAPDGSFTYWEFKSEGERRTSRALQLSASGPARMAGLEHRVEAGLLFTNYTARMNDAVFDIAGLGKVDGSLQTPPSAGFLDSNTHRDERSTELFARDTVKLAPAWQLFAGLRHSRIERKSQRTITPSDALGDKPYEQSFTTPWLALSHELAPGTIAYASWGRGLESEATPSRARYTNAGETFTLQSRQLEIGLKHAGRDGEASVALFDITRPQTFDRCDFTASTPCTRIVDGSARHRGLEAAGTMRTGPWLWQASAMWLDARRQGSSQAAVNGRSPANVPRATLRLGSEFAVGPLPGLALLAQLSAEGQRHVLPPGREVYASDADATIPGWTRLDLGLRWRQQWQATTLVWRLGVDNATDQQAWKESPYQFSHVYLYPLAPRTWRASVQASF